MSWLITVPLAVIVLSHGMRITPLVSPWSTMTKIESKPSTGGKSVMRSIKQLANGRVDRTGTCLGTDMTISAYYFGIFLKLLCTHFEVYN